VALPQEAGEDGGDPISLGFEGFCQVMDDYQHGYGEAKRQEKLVVGGGVSGCR
jgi:hypothetical protein